VDAIVCSSDTLAHGALIEAGSRNVKVPEQLAVMGFGDLSSPRIPGRRSRLFGWMGLISAGWRRKHRGAVEGDGGAPGARLIDTGFELIQRGST
jgi:LacI family gluconate utilization system Gnt-I transcriptional repressor